MQDRAYPLGEAPTRSRSGLGRWAKPVIGIAVSALFLWLAFRGLSWADIGATLARVNWALIPLAVLSLAAGYTARITRWWVMLRPSSPTLTWGEAARPYLVSIAANNVLPLRIGDVLRLFAFRGRPGLEAGRVGGTLVVERLLDLFVLLALFAVLLPLVPAFEGSARVVNLASWAAGMGALAIVCLFLLPVFEQIVLRRLAARPAISNSALAGKILGIVAMISDTLRQLGRPSRMLSLVLLSIGGWLMEGGVFVVAAQASAVHLDLAGAYFALALATLSTLLPSSPGYVGTYHFFAIQAAMAFGADASNAAAFAILAHLLVWAPTTVAGFIVFAMGSLQSGGRAGREPSQPSDAVR